MGRFKSFWNRRSRIGKTGLVVGALFLVLVIASLAAPSDPGDSDPVEEVAPLAPESAEAAPEEEEAVEEEEEEEEPPLLVERVIDGDTIDVDNGDRIRLVQIDAPESKGECYGRKAGTVLRRIIPPGTEVILEADPALDDVDRYGRLLRYVFAGDENVNLLLVERGAASVWYFRGDKGAYAGQLLRAAKRAKANERGAWGACPRAELTPTEPFETDPPDPPPPPPPPPAPTDCAAGYEPCLPIVDDLNCPDVEAMGLAPVTVTGDDPYRLDADGDGVGCE